MSSEYSIHLGDNPITGRVDPLRPAFPSTVVRLYAEARNIREGVVLYIKDDRLLEMSLLFGKISHDLAALLPGKVNNEQLVARDSLHAYSHSHPHAHGHRHAHLRIEQEDSDAIPIDDAREAVEPPHRWG